MKVLFIQDSIKEGGGVCRYIKDLQNALHKNKIESEIFEYHEILNKKNNSLFFNIELYLKLRKKIKEYRPDVIHINNTHKFQNSVYLACIKNNVIKMAHDYWIIYPVGGLNSPDMGWIKHNFKHRRNFMGEILERFLLKKIKIVSYSRELYDKLRKKEYNVYYVPIFQNLKSKKREKKNHILYVGYLHENKGVKFLLEAFSDFLRMNNKYKLVLVGDGPEKKKSSSKIAFLGWKEREELEKIYSESLVLIIPSIIPETGPIVFIEGMNFGLPILGSNVPGIRERILEHRNGLLFKKEDKEDFLRNLKKILKNNKLKEFSKKSRSEIYKYSTDNHLKKILKIYTRTYN